MVKILLVNPPIYDFAAYDFWLKPYGVLHVAGTMRGKGELSLFDYLDREDAFSACQESLKSDKWGRGRFYCERIDSPACLADIPRYFRRFGLPRENFVEYLKGHEESDFVFIQTMMTYWYLGVAEVIEDVRKFWGNAKIVLGGNYVTICREHAEGLGADKIVYGNEIDELWEYVGVEPDLSQPGLWEVYDKLKIGVLKLTDGCPFQCTYCSVPKVYGKFKRRSISRSLAELELQVELGAKNIAFYDDALLFDAENVLIPFLKEVLRRGIKVNFHTPNALNARFVSEELAELMVESGFKTFYLGFESASVEWQRHTGGKVFSGELAKAVSYLKSAGVKGTEITAYQIIGHPKSNIQELEESMGFVNSLGIRGMPSDFSPIPGTDDGELCRKYVDMNEPLMHNKSAFPIVLMGFEEINRLKEIQRQYNRQIT